MLLQIPDVLTAEQVAEARQILDRAAWVDGKVTAGHQSARAKDNQQLSEDRAFAVKKWLESQTSAQFPEGRVKVFAHGQENPLEPNGTPAGRAKNRRVEIVLGTAQ